MKKYLVMTIRNPSFQEAAREAHYMYLTELRERGLIEAYGPFTGGIGGAYLLKASSLKEAEELAFKDPLHTTGSSSVTVYEWNIV